LVAELDRAGLKRLTPYAWLGQTSSTNQSSFRPGSPKPTLEHPCAGAIPREHSHFFDDAGQFGSLDWLGSRVDDGSYRIVAAHELRIGNVRFRYAVDGGGTRLRLSPILTKAVVRKALAKPDQFSSAGWAVSVAYPSYTWTRVECQGWC
jgi:hypothetical protein